MSFLEKQFKLSEHGTNAWTEVLAGLTTFMTLSYIIFVQPAVMGIAGMDMGAVLVATCVASAAACLLMAFTANYPIALAPAMGHNFFFSLVVCKILGFTWQEALAAVFIAGAVFLVLSFFGFRAKIMEIIPDSLKRAIAGGIGLLIALIGLEYAGIVVGQQGTLVRLGNLRNPYTALALFGLVVTISLYALRMKGAIIVGMVLTLILGLATGLLGTEGFKSYESLSPGKTILKLDFAGLFTHGLKDGEISFGNVLLNIKTPLTVILIFLFLDVFDTVGTLIGVSERAGLLRDGKLPKARWALFSDAAGTVMGAALGTSTVTSYVESAAGVQAGGRTGLSNVTTAALFLISILAYPVLGIVASTHHVTNPFVSPDLGKVLGSDVYPVIAPALIVVGAMMLQAIKNIQWDDPTEFVPAFLTLVVMPLTVNITEGIAFGLISYSLLKFATRRHRDAHWGIHVLSVVLLLRYFLLRV